MVECLGGGVYRRQKAEELPQVGGTEQSERFFVCPGALLRVVH